MSEEWVMNRKYGNGSIVSYKEKEYKYVGFEVGIPPNQPTFVWLCSSDIKNWSSNEWYNEGEKICYNIDIYVCIQSHKSILNETPNIARNIWKLIFKDKTTPQPMPQPTPQPNSKSNPIESLSFSAISDSQIHTILQLTSIFENSTLDLKYDYVEDINDGRGYTFGFVGFCSGTYDGSQMLAEYSRLIGGNDSDTIKYLNAMKAIDAQRKGMNPSLVGLNGFINYVKKNGKKYEWIQANLNMANKLYVIPSQKKAKELGLVIPLSMGQLYDSYLNHGESGALSIIKKTGNVNGNEKAWLEKYLQNRYNILAQDRTWSSSVDRIKVYQKLLVENPSLHRPMNVRCYGSTFTLVPFVPVVPSIAPVVPSIVPVVPSTVPVPSSDILKLNMIDLSDFKNSKSWNIIKVGHGDKSTLHGIVSDPLTKSGQVLKVNYLKGSYKPSAKIDGGIGFYASPIMFPAKSVKLTYELYFADNFDPIKGGKLPGLFIGPPGASGGKHDIDNASCRVMWRKEEGGLIQAEAYAYTPCPQDSSFKDIPNIILNSKYGDSLWRGIFNFKKGMWNKVDIELTLNTISDGKVNADGKLKMTINETMQEYNKFKWTITDSVINGITFDTFFGGGSPDWATPRDTCIYYKNFIIERFN